MSSSLTVNVQEAKTRLSELLARVEAGDQVTIARHGRPVARLELIGEAPRREFGRLDVKIPDEVWFEPIPEEELAAWE